MRLVRTLLLVFCLIFISKVEAQDIHWSLFNYSPLTLNPSSTGKFSGTFRLGGIFRDQLPSVLGNVYKTPSVYIDAPLLMVGKRDWIGAGITFYSDKAGEFDLSTTMTWLSVAFHKSLDKRSQKIFSIGINGGFGNRSIDQRLLSAPGVFEDQIRLGAVGGSSLDLDNIGEMNSFVDFGIGAQYTSKVRKQAGVNIGLAISHITSPRTHLIEGNELRDISTNTDETLSTRLPLRVNLHGEFNFDLNKKWSLDPAFLFGRQANATEGIVQAWLGLKLKNEKQNVKLKFGPGYRVGDSAMLLLGMDIGDIKVGASYDVNLSGLQEISNTVGGFEIAISYIGKIYKTPEIKPVILCPKL